MKNQVAGRTICGFENVEEWLNGQMVKMSKQQFDNSII